MDPPSPSKFPMSPGMPVFAVSPERVAGVKPPYGGPPPQSPLLPDLRASPTRGHRRDDSTVGTITSMFEKLAVKDPKEAHAKYVQMLEKQQSKHAAEVKEMQRKHSEAVMRLEVRNEELKTAAKAAQSVAEDTIPRELWDRQRQDHREAIAKWEKAMQYSEEKRKQAERKAHEFSHENNILKTKAQQYKKKNMELSKDAMRASSYVPTLQAKIQGLERNARIAESDLKFQSGEAEKYKNMVYGLQVELESVEGRLSDEIQTLKDRIRLIEGERDALKTSLKEEEVLRIAAEGQIPLPAATTEEHDDFGSPVRSPRKQRTPESDEDKENVAPKRATVELKFVQQELASEKRLRERAQDQVEFMKMECQFRCCSCRIADLKSSSYVHDGSYAAEMERIKASVPEMTPPPSSHEDDMMEGVIIKEEPTDDDARPFSPTVVDEQAEPAPGPTEDEKQQRELPQARELSVFPKPPGSPAPASTMAFSPTSGTFAALSLPAKAPASTYMATPVKPSGSAIHEPAPGSSPWTPDANSTVIHHEKPSPPRLRRESVQVTREELRPQTGRDARSQNFVIHEDSVAESDEENVQPETPGPETPGQYVTRTITTVTTIPLHFSPLTPATKSGDHALTPSTVAHAPTHAQSQAMSDLALNSLPFDREAALEAIRLRRGRARSMAAGHGTPQKQMLEGVKERRDISAPVNRVRR